MNKAEMHKVVKQIAIDLIVERRRQAEVMRKLQKKIWQLSKELE